VLALGVPGVALFCIGLPLGSALFLRANVEKLTNVHFASQYVLMYVE
jgi:hypothetical protein